MTDNLKKILNDMEGIMGDMVRGQKLQNTFNSQLITLLQEISARTLVMSGLLRWSRGSTGSTRTR